MAIKNCEYCSNTFEAKFKKYRFCSEACVKNHRFGEVVEYGCLSCGDLLTKRSKSTSSQIRKFCSRSCSTAYYNARSPKLVAGTGAVCPKCSGKKSYDSTQCQSCRSLETWNSKLDSILFDVQLHDSASRAKNNTVRKHAREMMDKFAGKKKCRICGWDVHVDVCHIRAISDFDPYTAKLKEVNSLDNLVYLCKNHHAMFDDGMLDV